MNRRQQERANKKYAAGLSKKLRKADMSEWDDILKDSEHHILKLNAERK